MNDDTAWKRKKLIGNELDKISRGVAPLMQGRSHEEAVDAYIQQLYTALTDDHKPHPKNWEHAHNHVIFCYRLYYRGNALDPLFPAPSPPKEILVASEKPKQTKLPRVGSSAASVPPIPLAAGDMAAEKEESTGAGGDVDLEFAKIVQDDVNADERRRMLNEVRDHLELLKEFEGVIPADELAKRKRELFMALPPAPPLGAAATGSMSSKKQRRVDV
jgi:hypothetical protein